MTDALRPAVAALAFLTRIPVARAVHVDADELRRLGTAFELQAYDLSRHLSAFRRRTDAGRLRDDLGEDAASVADVCELSETAGRMIGRLQDRLDEIGSGLKTGAVALRAADEETADVLRGVR